ncbi:TPA: Bor family protein [Aeromonas hydrophila]|uniref:Bor family protein n=1 Tax=Aeromonas hydrophila TaxID=644 RepID=UPI0021E92E58|nr:Bor family protein [Aeromonas hydrophila]MCV3295478.1 Bor family protein [Aeromonas hydrophila]
MKKVLLTTVVAMLLAGCAQQGFTVNSGNTVKPTKNVTHHFFISGLGQSKTIDAATVCNGADKVVRVEAQHTFLNGLLSAVTLGIYTPREARVYCSI